jgi:hypothetical protein
LTGFVEPVNNNVDVRREPAGRNERYVEPVSAAGRLAQLRVRGNVVSSTRPRPGTRRSGPPLSAPVTLLDAIRTQPGH